MSKQCIYWLDHSGGVPVYDVQPEARVWAYYPEGVAGVAGMYPRPIIGNRFWLPQYLKEAMPSVCRGLPPIGGSTADFEQALQEWVSAHFEVPWGWQLQQAWVVTQADWRGLCCVIVPLEAEALNPGSAE